MFLELAHTKQPVFAQSKKLIVECYKVTNTFPTSEKYALVQQMNRAAVSVHLNIAEDCSRRSGVERKRFFEIARRSVIELDTAVGVACELGYIKPNDVNSLGQSIIGCFKQLTGMIGA